MKILFANKFFFRNGGSEIVMFDEMKYLKKQNHDVIEFAMHDERNLASTYSKYFVSQKNYHSPSKSERVKAALSIIHSGEAVKNFNNLLMAEKPDIIHCHNIYHQLTPSIIHAAERRKVPVVMTLHDYKPLCPVYTQISHGEICTKCSQGRFGSLVLKRCAGGSFAQSALLWAEARYHAAMRSYERVTAFIAPSRFMRDAVAQRFTEKVVAYIPNGIDTSTISTCNPKEEYVLYLGRLSSEKGVETLLRAHVASHRSWRLVIAGTGPLFTELSERYTDAEFRGHLTGADLHATINAASIVVIPSEWHENSPLSVLETMAHGKPIVAARIGGIPELVREGLTGLLFQPKNVPELAACIHSLIIDLPRRRSFGIEARRQVEADYSIESHGEAIVSLYGNILDKRKISKKGVL